jgi:methylated-DNA-[protein]-cysteine S-methyltransferase
MEKILIRHFPAPYGDLVLGSFRDRLCLCDWKYRKMRTVIDNRIRERLQAEYSEGESEINARAESQLLEYFAGRRKEFSIPLIMAGTEMQEQVWSRLTGIPYGKTISYLELSKQLGKPDAVRAIAAANGANAISIIIPCHRVIGINGDLTGYAGGLNVKRKLLQLEQGQIQEDLFGE